jgi:hypothetical protein
MTMRRENVETLQRNFAGRAEQRRRVLAPRIAVAERLSAELGLGDVTGIYQPGRTALRTDPGLLYAFAGGLVRAGGGAAAPDVTRWDQVVAIYRLLADTFSPAAGEVTGAKLAGHRFRRADGTEFCLSTGLDNGLDPLDTSGRAVLQLLPSGMAAAMPAFPKLGTLVELEVTRCLLPGALAGYAQGAAVWFGPAGFSQQGVTVGSQTLPWRAVAKIQTQSSMLTIRRRGNWLRYWQSFKSESVPNLCVLEALLDQRDPADS